MQGFIKTLIGDRTTLAVAVADVLIALALLHSPAARFSGLVLPLCLLASVAFLARR